MNIYEAQRCVGRKVVYRAPHLRPDEPGEEGVITSVNGLFVFVRYGSDGGSKATEPGRLTLIGGAK